MTNRKASVFMIVLAALLLIFEVTRPKYTGAELSGGSAQGDRMPDTLKLHRAALHPEKNVGRESERQTMQLAREIMTCPQDIPVPPGIPTHKYTGTRTVFPKHRFEEMYLQGWNECLFLVSSKTGDIDSIEMSSCLNSFKNDEGAGAGLVAGFDGCRQQIIVLAEIYNVDLIRRVAKELYREFPDGVCWRRQ